METKRKNGYYSIGDNQYKSVTSIIGSVYGIPSSLVEHYHLRNAVKLLLSDDILVDNIQNLRDISDEAIRLPQIKIYAKQLMQASIDDRDQKADYGTKAHTIMNNCIRFGYEAPADFVNRVRKVKEVLQDLQIEILPATEGHEGNVVYSHMLQSAGTNDFMGISRKYVNPIYYVADFKTGSKDKHKECIQAGAYGYFPIEMGTIPKGSNPQGIIFHIGRSDDEFEFYIFDEISMKRGYKAFIDLVKLSQYSKIKL